MSLLRLKKRVPSTKKLGIVTLKNYQLRFNMSSNDGSGKCDSFHTNNDEDKVIGAKKTKTPADYLAIIESVDSIEYADNIFVTCCYMP
jgi:hypothetical protein